MIHSSNETNWQTLAQHEESFKVKEELERLKKLREEIEEEERKKVWL